jgi:hypothetical protein
MAVGRQAAVADGEDPAMNAMPPSGARSMLDGSGRHPQRNELPMRDDSVLPLRELGNSRIEGDLEGAWADLGRYVRPK